MSGSEDSVAKCPVDHKSREAWLKVAQAQREAGSLTGSASPAGISQSTVSPTHHPSQISSSSSSSSTPPPSSPSSSHKIRSAIAGLFPPGVMPASAPSQPPVLNTEREVSSIPRAGYHGSSETYPSQSAGTPLNLPRSQDALNSHSSPANSEAESGTSTSGNWIYPSEKMFFEAMKRKQFDPRHEDMRAIVPIHNAVNERAWKEILDWEKGKGGESCGGPKLLSFSGMASALTPRARFNTLLGYQPPFDRHDWVVDRCGTRIEYVIDFYVGKNEQNTGKPLSFYLDVRPKLNSWEGWKMRFLRVFGA